MASVLVDGLRVPLPVAGRPALDFLNTRAGWPTQTNEYLHTYPHLAVWARERGLVGAAQCRRSLVAARRDPGRGGRTYGCGRCRCARRCVRCWSPRRGRQPRGGPGGRWSARRRLAQWPVRSWCRRPTSRCSRARPAGDPTTDGIASVAAARRDRRAAGAVRGAGARHDPAAHRAGRTACTGVPYAGLRLGLRRPQRTAAVVLDGLVRQPVQGPPPPRPHPPERTPTVEYRSRTAVLHRRFSYPCGSVSGDVAHAAGLEVLERLHAARPGCS